MLVALSRSREPVIQQAVQDFLGKLRAAFLKNGERRVWVSWSRLRMEKDIQDEAWKRTESTLNELGYACEWMSKDEDYPDRVVVWVP